jgi:hypothetical protein
LFLLGLGLEENNDDEDLADDDDDDDGKLGLALGLGLY